MHKLRSVHCLPKIPWQISKAYILNSFVNCTFKYTWNKYGKQRIMSDMPMDMCRCAVMPWFLKINYIFNISDIRLKLEYLSMPLSLHLSEKLQEANYKRFKGRSDQLSYGDIKQEKGIHFWQLASSCTHTFFVSLVISVFFLPKSNKIFC